MLKRNTDLRRPDSARRAIAFWAEVAGEDPIRPVRVFVTYNALAALDPGKPRNVQGALDTFDANRALVDRAASSKFDAGDLDTARYEGQLVVTIKPDDLTLLHGPADGGRRYGQRTPAGHGPVTPPNT